MINLEIGYDKNYLEQNRNSLVLFDTLLDDSASRRCCHTNPCRRAAMVSHSILQKSCFF